MFKQKTKRKIHLSPRLARSVNEPTPGKKTLALLIFLSAFLAVLAIQEEKSNWQSVSRAEIANGEVLGAHTSTPIAYTIQSGDTLVGISERFQIHWTMIVEENEMSSPYRLYPGQVIRIPASHN